MTLSSPILRILIPVFILAAGPVLAEESYPPHPDSVVHAGVAKGELIKGSFIAGTSSVFPGTEREYQIYLPAGFDKSKPAPFMVFQDGVIYNAPVVFDNLIAKKEIPQLVGVFIRPGVVPAANPAALPRFNRSYEYDSVSDTYSKFLINEFLPAIEARHGIKLSTDPNDAAISGNSSGGICAFMTCWHRPDRFRRIYSGVGTYVGIRGADQLSVLVRKTEPKPLRVYLQSGENDNNLYCGDWWMANQMMERSLTWAGYDVNHTWGTGGHNQKHATAIFPDVMRWLWRDYATAKEIKANPRGESKWRGYEVMREVGWEDVSAPDQKTHLGSPEFRRLASTKDGLLYVIGNSANRIRFRTGEGEWAQLPISFPGTKVLISLNVTSSGKVAVLADGPEGFRYLYELSPKSDQGNPDSSRAGEMNQFVCLHSGRIISAFKPKHPMDPFDRSGPSEIQMGTSVAIWNGGKKIMPEQQAAIRDHRIEALCASPDQTMIYAVCGNSDSIYSLMLGNVRNPDPTKKSLDVDGLGDGQVFGKLQQDPIGRVEANGLCVDTEGRLYVATALGIQVCDQAGRVNFIIPTPQQPYDVCFGGKDLGELFIACGDKIYKRQTKVHGYISGQMAPIKPAPPKL
jgi:gluconolactonase